MEKNTHATGGLSCHFRRASRAALVFAGALAALTLGWWAFPDLTFSKRYQPFYFSHAVHAEKAGLRCADCHTLNGTGPGQGLPKLETCASCHAEIMTARPDAGSGKAEKAAYEAEKTFVETYVKTGREVPWVVHQYQPDNVFFSHAAHYQKCFDCHRERNIASLGSPEDPQKLCMRCHPPLEALDKNIPVEKSIFTGYSRTTMKMENCKPCHTYNAPDKNECQTCHR